MTMTPLQKRAERRNRNQTMVDMNLVSLIDVFTILIFFLMSNVGGVETHGPATRAVKLPESLSQKTPRETLLVVVTGSEILVGSKVVSSVVDAMAVDGDLIQPLKSELDLQVGREVFLKAENEADSQAPVTIIGDKEIPYKPAEEGHGDGCTGSGYTDVSFAVRQKVRAVMAGRIARRQRQADVSANSRARRSARPRITRRTRQAQRLLASPKARCHLPLARCCRGPVSRRRRCPLSASIA